MRAPSGYDCELAAVGGKTAHGQPRYRLYWTGDAMPGYPGRKFATPIDCWALLWWVDNDSEAPNGGGGYAVLQAFYKASDQGTQEYEPTMLDTIGLNVRVVTMMAAEAERHRHDFVRVKHALLERQRARANEQISGQIADLLQDAAPQFTGPTDFGGGGPAGQTLVEKKVEQIEKNLDRTNALRRRFGLGNRVQAAESKA